jgi:hypothetical protein
MDFSNIPDIKAITILVPANNSKLKWPIYNVPRLTGDQIESVVRGIEVKHSTQLPIGPGGEPIASEAMENDAYLVLVNGREEVLDTIPLNTFNPINYQGLGFYVTFNDVDWSRSFIVWGRNNNLPAAPLISNVPITVYYTTK